MEKPANVYEESDTKIKTPACICIAGQSGAGKTTVALRLLHNVEKVLNPTPKSILYCYGVYNADIKELQKLGIETCLGLPSEELLKGTTKPALVLLDDLMLQLNARRDYIAELVTHRSHHSNIS